MERPRLAWLATLSDFDRRFFWFQVCRVQSLDIPFPNSKFQHFVEIQVVSFLLFGESGRWMNRGWK
jgi:hypothetical protein